MKKLITIVVVIAGLAGGYYKLSTTRLDFSFARGETVVVHRGDLTIPINATGPISPRSRHEIKSEASGEVIEIRFRPGDMVGKGDLLIRLDKVDEQRSVDAATADVTRSEAALDKAKLTKERLATVGLDQATQRVKQVEAQMSVVDFNLRKLERLEKEKQTSDDEMVRVRANHAELAARLAGTKADLKDAGIAVQSAAHDITLAEAAHNQALTNLGNAEERLADTDIHSPVNGMVVKLNTQIGEVIQGGKTTFTGGTVLVVVADVSKLYVYAEVDEADIGAVVDLAQDWAKPGQRNRSAAEPPIATATPVKVHVESFRDEAFAGIIERVHPEPSSIGSSVVTYRVDILLTSDNRHKLLIGMQADVEFAAQAVENVVLVPHEAIRRNDFDELGVYVAEKDEQGKAKRKFVKCRFGLDNGMYTEVREGVSDGVEVYTKLPRISDRDSES